MPLADDLGCGLSPDEAARRLVDVGPNEVAPRHRLSAWASLATQLKDPLILVLLAAAVLTLATGDLPDAAVISLVVVINSTVGVVQELRADRAVAALSQLAAPFARVRRGGDEVRIPVAEIVPGDVVLLGEGDIVPADASVIEASALWIDEAALTGESLPVGKSALAGEHELSAGTVVVKGRAVAVITATGTTSALGRIAVLLGTGAQITPLQRRLAHLGGLLAAVVVALCAVVMALGLARGEPIERTVIIAISLAVAAVPESLPAVITLSLAIGARKMARHQAIVRRLPAIETLGSVTVLATDKTGTLTTGQMRAEKAWTMSGDSMLPPAGVSGPGSRHEVAELLTVAALCNDARLARDSSGSGLGDPTELALLLAAADFGLDVSAKLPTHPRIAELPFDSNRQRMMTLHRARDGYLTCVKGAPESVLPCCNPAGAYVVADVLQRAAALAEAGYRVLAIATARLATMPANLIDAEKDLRLLGLVAIADPPKEAAAAAIAAIREAGIVPVLITGDHRATALAIAARVGIDASQVYARVNPERKLDIIQELRDGGAVVAMIGDGVNDGPALHRADIGVAMGLRGTEVARQAADLILADDELATVVFAVEEGRRVYANVRRFLTFGLAGGAAEIAVMLVGPFIGLAVPLLAAQILWINLVTHGITGVAIAAEPSEPGVMRRPPRPPSESVLGDGLWLRILRMGTIVAGGTLAIGWWSHHSGREWQSITFVALTALQIGIAVGLRARPRSWANLSLPTTAAASIVLVLAGIYLPPLRDLLGTVALPWTDAVLAVAAGTIGWIAIRLDLALCQHGASRKGRS